MKERNDPQPLRLRRKHGEGRRPDVTAEDGARIVYAQSFRNAIVASLITLIVFCFAWVALSAILDRVFPWMTVVLGAAIGMAIRVWGRGVDWRFPVLAATMAGVGSIASNVVLAASTTAEVYGTGTLQVLQAATHMTWPVFFREVWNVGDSFFAAVAAGLAAFLAPRRLSRSQRFALRLWRASESDGHQ